MERLTCSGCGSSQYGLFANEAGALIVECQNCGARSILTIKATYEMCSMPNDNNQGKPVVK